MTGPVVANVDALAPGSTWKPSMLTVPARVGAKLPTNSWWVTSVAVNVTDRRT
jgi:hypothetical protein